MTATFRMHRYHTSVSLTGIAIFVAIVLGATYADADLFRYSEEEFVQVFEEPVGELIEDMNGDSRPDFIRRTGDWIEVRITGSGNVGPALVSEIPVPENRWLQSERFLQLTSDGILDLVVISKSDHLNDCRSGTLQIAHNDGSGRFELVQTYEFQEVPFSVEPADLNGDQILDLVIATRSDNCPGSVVEGQLFILNGVGDGVFGVAVDHSQPYSLHSPAAVGDLTGDGMPDIALGAPAAYLPNLGNDLFGLPREYGFGRGAHLMEAHDVDLDGADDLAIVGLSILNRAGLSIVLSKQGGTSFIPVATAGVAEFSGLSVHDIDVDGAPEFFIYGRNQRREQYTAGFEMIYRDAERNLSTLEVAAPGYSGATPSFGDLNNDGLEDVVVSGAHVTLVLSDDGGYFVQPAMWRSGGRVLDWDEDGHPDLISSGNDGIWVMRNHGDGTFPAWLASALPGRVVGSAELNGRGFQDVLVYRSSGSQLGIAEIHVPGKVPSVQWYTGFGSNLHDVHINDMNDDGNIDVVIVGSERLMVGWNRGDSLTTTFAAAGAAPTSVTSGDFNEDGVSDLVSNGWFDFLLLIPGQLDGNFGEAIPFPGDDPLRVGSGDFDADGHLDLVSLAVNGTVQLRRGMGDGTFGDAEALGDVGTTTPAIEVFDFDADGDIDIAVFATHSSVLINDGTGTFNAVELPIGAGNEHAFADFDGDRKPEFVASSTEGTRIWRNLGDGTFELCSTIPNSSGPYVASDFTGDRIVDLFSGSTFFENLVGTTPVLFSEFSATTGGGLAHLRWQLGGRVARWSAVIVQRATRADGPFENRSRLEPHASMEFLDSISQQTEYWYRLAAAADGGEWSFSPVLYVDGRRSLQGPELDAIPPVVAGIVRIQYRLHQSDFIRLTVHDIRGRLVSTLLEGPRSAGIHTIEWPAADESGVRLARGIYFTRLEATRAASVRRLILLR